MKTPEEIKDQIAVDNGYRSWEEILLHLTQSRIATILVEQMENAAMEMYKEQFIKK